MARPAPTNDGHKDKFGAPGGGWPTFDKDGKRIRDDKPKGKRGAK